MAEVVVCEGTSMGLRFRRSFKLLPGVRINLSKGGISTSIGPKGATINVGGGGKVKATMGVPGTGLSYSATSQSVPDNASASSGSRIVTASQTIRVADETDGPDVTYALGPDEVVYRIAALLAAVLIANADASEAEVRIAGLLPEWLPNGVSSPSFAKTLLASALGLDGTTYQGTAAIRRAITKAGLQKTGSVGAAVNAVRASMRVRGHEDNELNGLPVEWYRVGNALQHREYEAPSVRDRIPAAKLEGLHSRQVELGQQRQARPDLLNPVRQPLPMLDRLLFLLIRLVFYMMLGVVGIVLGVVVFAVIKVLTESGH